MLGSTFTFLLLKITPAIFLLKLFLALIFGENKIKCAHYNCFNDACPLCKFSSAVEKAARNNKHCLHLANAEARDLPVPARAWTAPQAWKPSWVLYGLLNLWG